MGTTAVCFSSDKTAQASEQAGRQIMNVKSETVVWHLVLILDVRVCGR